MACVNFLDIRCGSIGDHGKRSNMRKLQIALAAAALLSAPSLAADETKASAADDGDKIVCKVDKTTGSAISDRVCKKRSAWRAERENAKRYLDKSRWQDFDQSKVPARPAG
jgi:hypothetical protein